MEATTTNIIEGTHTNITETDNGHQPGAQGENKTPFSTKVRYRRAGPTDILKCARIGVPRRTKRELQYWQHHASPYFICAFLQDDDSENDDNGDDGNNNNSVGENRNTNNNCPNQIENTVHSDNNSILSHSNHQQHHNHDHDHDDDHHRDEDDVILGFISGIRLDDDTNYGPNDEMLVEKTSHRPNGKVLAIRAVTVRTDDDELDDEDDDDYDDKNKAERVKKAKINLRQAMLQHYIAKMKRANRPSNDSEQGGRYQRDGRPPMEKLVALCRSTELPLYLDSGFSAVRLSKVTEAQFDTAYSEKQKDESSSNPNRMYYLELSLSSTKGHIKHRPSLTDHSLSLSRTSTKDGSIGTIFSPECYIVDSFTDRPGTGNPAAVVLLQEGFDVDNKQKTKWMQTVAAEFNLAETAFCWPQRSTRNNESDNRNNELRWNIRYFTPTVEMPLCGHATLASAAVLYQSLPLSSSRIIVFHASQDVLTMRLAEDGTGSVTDRISRISMDFPPKPAKELTTRDDKSAVRNMLSNAFGGVDLQSAMLFVGSSELGDLLIELTPQAFSDIGYDSLNFKAFLEWDGYYRGVIICCMATNENDAEISNVAGESNRIPVDFLSRFFAPKAGINEDDVTGSAHCILGPYYSKKLKKNVVVGRQVSKRSGIIECRITEDCVTLTGSAIVTMSGVLHM